MIKADEKPEDEILLMETSYGKIILLLEKEDNMCYCILNRIISRYNILLSYLIIRIGGNSYKR